MKDMLERSRIAVDEHSPLSSMLGLHIIADIIAIIVVVVDESEMVRVARKLVLSREHSIEH